MRFPRGRWRDDQTGRRDSAPLWPAGHLPHTGGDRMRHGLRQWPTLEEGAADDAANLPLVGEMPGRAEGALSRQPV
ncbi:hypothetical protein EB232_14650 [Mesorhizobium sp. NZP2077]|nr:hypothetical protein EB232_14650 [Mesorhizobium sp. NZP2077]